jgi:hypothetical protein
MDEIPWKTKFRIMKGLMYCLYHEKVSHLFARSDLDYAVNYDAKWQWSSVPSMVMLYFNWNIFLFTSYFFSLKFEKFSQRIKFYAYILIPNNTVYNSKWKWSSVPSMVTLFLIVSFFFKLYFFSCNLKNSHSALNSNAYIYCELHFHFAL